MRACTLLPPLLLLLLLAACSAPPEPSGHEAGPAATPVDERIACATGDAPLERACSAEREGAMLTLRKPDGGFRRLRVTEDGTGLAAADGAEPARVAIVGEGEIEVAIGADRFRLPAAIAAR